METLSVYNKAAVFFMISFRHLCLITVSLPLGALLICFVTAYIFQQDDIHETHCRVYNVIPSISSITGISPQRYLWRICIAFHVGPRVVIATVYRSYYRQLLSLSKKANDVNAIRWLDLCYWLNVVEIAGLCGVTYISNRENYPIHEKIFILFMFGSLTYMCVSIKVYKLVKPNMTETEKTSYFLKKCLFIVSILCTIGLLIFFLKHRLLCHEMAFSWFSLCEYCIASANMAFHVTVILDFPTENCLVMRDLPLVNENSTPDSAHLKEN